MRDLWVHLTSAVTIIICETQLSYLLGSHDTSGTEVQGQKPNHPGTPEHEQLLKRGQEASKRVVQPSALFLSPPLIQ